jgi:hypothetical protein
MVDPKQQPLGSTVSTQSPVAAQPSIGNAVQPGLGQPAVASEIQSPSLDVAVSPLRQVISAASALNQGYTTPTTSQPNFTAPPNALDQASLQQLSDYFKSLDHPMITGQTIAHPASFSLNALTDGQGLRFVKGAAASGTNPKVWAAAGRSLWDSTIGGWIHTMQTDPGRGLLEAAGLVGGIAAIATLEVVTGGAATPFIVGGLGALGAVQTLPTLANSFADEWSNPTDENMTKLLVSTGNAWLAIGSPIKGIRGMKAARELLGSQIGKLGNLPHLQGMVSTVVSGDAKWRSLIGESSPIDQQMAELPIGAEKLSETLTKMGVETPEAKKLLQSTQGYEALVEAFKKLSPTDLENKDKIAAEIQNALKGDLLPARVKFAINYGFRPEITAEGQGLAMRPLENATIEDVRSVLDQGLTVPSKWAKAFPELEKAYPGQFKVTPFNLTHEYEAEKALPQEFHDVMKQHFGTIAGTMVDRAKVTIDRPEVALEKSARGVTGGGIQAGHAEMVLALEKMMEHAGVTTADWPKIRDVLEDESLASDLTGEQLAFARNIGWINNLRTVNDVRVGHADLPLAGRHPRMVVHESGVDPADNPVRILQQAMLQRNVSPNRIWKAIFDLGRGQAEVQQKYQTAKEFEAEQAGKKGVFEQTRPVREYYLKGENKTLVTGLRRSLGGYKRGITLKKSAVKLAETYLADAKRGTDATMVAAAEKAVQKAKEAQQTAESRMAAYLKKVEADHGKEASQLVNMSGHELERTINANPGAMQLLHPYDALKLDLWRYLTIQHQEGLRQSLTTAAHMVGPTMTKEMGWLEKNLGVEFRRAQMKAHDLPSVVEETLFHQRGDAEREAQQAGYLKIMPAMGESGTMNFHPALYAREDLAKPFLQEMDKATGMATIDNAALRVSYNIGVAIPKRLAFVSPAWHAFNVAGRTLAGFLQDPALGGAAALRDITAKLHDPEQYARMNSRWRDAGLVPAQKFNLTNHVHHIEQERTAQHTWPGALRVAQAPLGAINDFYQNTLEEGFWKGVNDVGLIGAESMFARLRARLPNASDAQLETAAAQYGNIVGGMVNKQYMSKLWSYGSNLFFFAPRYWSTFKNAALSSVMPARLSQLLAKMDGAGGFINPVRLKSIDLSVRREMLRMQRGWFLTYMATTMAMTDLMNVMFAGKHVWDNPKGREWDVCFDKAFGAQPTAGGGTDHACISALPGLRQGADVLNALGLGHDYGLAHLMTDPQFAQADAIHKAGMEMDAAVDGLRRVGAGKISTLANVAPSFLTGQDTYNWLATGTKVNVPRLETLLQLTPVGVQAQRSIRDMVQSGVDPKQAATDIARAEVQQLTGLPTLYWTGAEKKPIDDQAFAQWQLSRTNFQKAALSDSQQLMSGQLTPYQWWLSREQRLSAQLQSDVDAFGQSTPAGALSAARQKLWTSLGLDNETIPREQRFQMIDQFNAGWQQLLDSASPQTRALWWDHERAQWTDADYLYWMTGQVKEALMSMIDGQGGAHIRAAQSAMGTFYNLPGLDPTVAAQLQAKDPYLYTYHSILKELGKMSPLGALTSAFTSPYSNTAILPSGLSQEALANIAAMMSTSSVGITGETAQSLAVAAEQQAGSAGGEAAGGQVAGTPQFQQQLSPAIKAAIEQYLIDHPGDQNASELEQVVAGMK